VVSAAQAEKAAELISPERQAEPETLTEPEVVERARDVGEIETARSPHGTTSDWTAVATREALRRPRFTPSDRLLAAADAYHAMTEPRPHRAPLDPDRASRGLRAEVIAGRLDGTAVDAVLTAAGHRAPARHLQPGGLTAREVEVLGLLGRGHSTKEIGRLLVVSRRLRPTTSSTSTPSWAFPAAPRGGDGR